MNFLKDIFSNAMGCIFAILCLICGLLAIISFFTGGLIGTNPWLGFGIFIVIAIIFFGIARAFSKRG